MQEYQGNIVKYLNHFRMQYTWSVPNPSCIWLQFLNINALNRRYGDMYKIYMLTK